VSEAIPPERITPTRMSNEEIASGCALAMTDCCKRLLRRFAPRNDEKVGTRNDGKGKSRNDGKKKTRNDVKKGTRNDEKEGKAFCNKKNVTKKSLRFSKVSYQCFFIVIRQNSNFKRVLLIVKKLFLF